VDRDQLQQLAELRLEDAEALIASGRWAAAYYLLGYSVECALKACVARQFRTDEVPDRELVNSFYTHRLDKLLSISGAKSEFEARAKGDPDFERSWIAAREWNEVVRYDLLITESVARRLYEAVTNGKSGILPWLKTQW
jgi:HEPN domain-containing protein